MSKVEMSLVEYNELMEKFNLYKEIAETVMTPTVEDWDLDYYKEHPSSALTVHVDLTKNLSAKAKNLVRDSILKGTETIIKSRVDCDGSFDMYESFQCTVGYVNHLKEGSVGSLTHVDEDSEE